MHNQTFTQDQMAQWARGREDISPQAASLAFRLLEDRAEALGVEVICPLVKCRGKHCKHEIAVNSFLQLQPRALIAVKRGGPRIALIVAEWQKHLQGGT